MKLRKDLGPYHYELEQEELVVLTQIKAGLPITVPQEVEKSDLLTRLRRNGFIDNVGSRGRPVWRTSDRWKSWPRNHHMIVTLDGECNEDKVLVEIEKTIQEGERMVALLKKKRDAYIAERSLEYSKLEARPSGHKLAMQ